MKWRILGSITKDTQLKRTRQKHKCANVCREFNDAFYKPIGNISK